MRALVLRFGATKPDRICRSLENDAMVNVFWLKVQYLCALFRSLVACPPPRLPSFEPFFRPITSLLRSSVLLTLIRTIIERTAKRSRYSSDALFHRVHNLLSSHTSVDRYERFFVNFDIIRNSIPWIRLRLSSDLGLYLCLDLGFGWSLNLVVFGVYCRGRGKCSALINSLSSFK